MEIGVVVGNPKPASRTLHAAVLLAEALADAPPKLVVDLAEFGGALLEWQQPSTTSAIQSITELDVVIFASPTYKATYAGLLKLFLDQIDSDGLTGLIAVPLMLGAGPTHALAPELLLKPVLVELGAICPTRGCYIMDGQYDQPAAYESWLLKARPIVGRLAAVPLP
jgi:FMN reductase